MSESTRVISRNEDADMEVELSAQDLRALSDASQNDAARVDQASQPAKPTTAVTPGKTAIPTASTKRPTGIVRLSLAVPIAVGGIGAAYLLNASQPSAQSPTNTASLNLEAALPVQQVVTEDPVRFANPFDKTEIFEFPAGTTETEAREAVAAALLERAISRQQT